MTRQWKPGDVALIRISAEHQPEVAVRGGGIFDGQWYVGGPRLGSQHGWPDNRVEVIRPLVVIDPADDDQVVRVIDALLAHGWTRQGFAHTAAALRSLIAPPKPEEPTGLGAVVEDAEGADWHRTRDGRWIAEDGLRSRAAGWDHIDAVLVLSEGVTA